jgi:3-oxoacyl-[acyl-carrier protein] reductase
MDLSGKVAIVTGAGQGIGRGAALKLACAGAKLVLAGRHENTLAAVQGEIQAQGKEATFLRTDVSQSADAQNLAKHALDVFGGIDILVNNAGIASTGNASWQMSTLNMDEQEWDRVLAVNLKGQFNCAKAVMPTLMKQRSGRIVNLSSTTGLTGAVGSAAYCASKAGIMAFTKVLARELGPYNICVNCVAPGLTMTPMQDSTPPELIAMASKMIPLGRAGVDMDIAHAILFLASDGLFVTGQTIVVDGGGTMH